MRLTPPPPDIGETDGLTRENDLFELREFGERLANLVCRLDGPLVIALDGPWGSGKSTFVRQWAGLLRQRNVPVILFDAFGETTIRKTHSSPLPARIRGPRSHDSRPKPWGGHNSIDKAKKVGRVLTPLAARGTIRAATLGLVAAEDLEGVQEFIKETGADASAVTERLIEERLKQAEADRKTLEAFRQSLRTLAGQLGSAEPTESDKDDIREPPLVFIIDELDRCRPPFALNLLERVKHLFSVENVCFVLVSHVPQLEVVVGGSYGLGVDARTYLEKFFHLRITLPERNLQQADRASQYIGHLWRVMGLASGDNGYDDATQRGIVALGGVYHLSLRTLERVAAYVALAKAASEGYLREPSLIAGLCVMKQLRPDLFARARSGTLEWKDTKEFHRIDEWRDENARAFYEKWWRFATEKDLPLGEQWVQEMQQIPLGQRLGREKILPFMCGHIEELRIVNT